MKKPQGRVVKPTPMPDLKDDFSSLQLAKAITAKRTAKRLKLVDVAAALAISKPTLVKIEKGDTNVSFANLLKVIDYLGLTFQIVSDDSGIERTPNEAGDDEWY